MNLFGYPIAQTLALLSVVINEFVFTYNCKELKTFSFKSAERKNTNKRKNFSRHFTRLCEKRR